MTRAEAGISGIYRMGAEQVLTGIVQFGKTTANIMFGGYTLPAMIDKSVLIFNAPKPLDKNVYVTYAGKLIFFIVCF